MHKYTRSNFKVEVDGVTRAAFMNCSPIKINIASIESWEGGAQIADKQPGRVTYDPITLERGVTIDEDLYNLLESLIDPEYGEDNVGNVGTGEDDESKIKFTCHIVQLGRNRKEKGRWEVKVAHVGAYENNGWDNNTDEALTEKLTLVPYYAKPLKRN